MRMNAKEEKGREAPALEKKRGKKASTTELPMVDLDAVLAFVDKIESQGLQTLSQQDVAKRLTYAAPTSTPFYRRMVGARLFGLIDTTQGVNLTKLALDYFKPTDEESKRHALVTAVRNVVGYQRIIDRFSEKRLPPLDILRNFVEREFDLASETANACADVFARSVKTAGLVRGDGTLSVNVGEHSILRSTPESTNTTQRSVPDTSEPSAEQESHYLTLDARLGRRVTLHAPPIITEAELKRIQNWLAVQFHVVDSLEVDRGEPRAFKDSSNNVKSSE